MNQKKIIFIVGPTAVGKTEAALTLAQEINGEIVSCDSMQVYQEIAIISNKPSPEILQTIPHHLIDVVSVREEFDVETFNRLALAAIGEIHQRSKIPIVCGGSGLYMQVLLDGIFKEETKDGALREELKRRLEKEGQDRIYQELQTVDPAAAAKIHVNDSRRIIRALEVYLTTDQPISELQKRRCGLWGKYDINIVALNRKREELYQRIDRRVEAMFAAGLLEEIKGLAGVPLSKTAQAVIGIPEVQGYLNGECDLSQAQELMQMNTRRLAKRQLTWFRRDQRLQWMMIAEGGSINNITKEIKEKIWTKKKSCSLS